MEKNKITQLFEETHVSISEVSKKSGVPYGTLYDIAKGKTPFDKIPIGTFNKIAMAFGMTPDGLLGDQDLDPMKYEVIDIYDSMSYDGKRALMACAEGLHDVFSYDALYDEHIADIKEIH